MWPFVQVSRDLVLDVGTDAMTYGRAQPIELTVALTNRGQVTFEVDAAQMNRAARVLVMEREGTGEIPVRLSSLYPGRRSLSIAAGERLETSIRVTAGHVVDRTETWHYQVPANVRRLQVFLPLARENPDNFSNMLSASADEVDVVDRWTWPAQTRARMGCLGSILRILGIRRP